MGWVGCGLPYADFWGVTLREYRLITCAVQRRKEAEVNDQRVLQQELAHLIGYAFHDPSNIPDFTKKSTPKQAEPVDDRLATEQLRSSLIRMHVLSQRKR